MSQERPLSHRLAAFEAAFCSGFFVPSSALTTALALVFERVHFSNELEYVLQLARNYRLQAPTADGSAISLAPVDDTGDPDPLSSLTPTQRSTANTYLSLAAQFALRYAPLFPKVFQSNPDPSGRNVSVELVRTGPGKLNTYRVTFEGITVASENQNALASLIDHGCVPVVAGSLPASLAHVSSIRTSPVSLAAALAISSVAMVLPATKGAHPDAVLEARSRLSDLLPQFWASMLKLTVELRDRSTASGAITSQQEVDNLVATLVRPALIELVAKLEKERKLWFSRVLAPVATGLRVLVGKPPTDLAGLLTTTLALSSDVALDAAQQMRKVEALKRESGLTYLIELDRLVTKHHRPKHRTRRQAVPHNSSLRRTTPTHPRGVRPLNS